MAEGASITGLLANAIEDENLDVLDGLCSRSVSTFVLPGAGHNLMEHRNAGAFEAELLGWLRAN